MFYPFLLTSLAGLSTLLGTLPIFIKFKNKDLIISASCSFAAGVMICISLFDLIPESIKYLRLYYSNVFPIIFSFVFIVFGILINYFIDTILERKSSKNSLFKVGILSMIAIILHNIPEGIVTFIVTKKDIFLGISICLAIALHNIPEGISISVPIYYSTNKLSKSILYTLVSALSEPFGAIITYLFLYKYINDFILGLLFSLIAGIMIELSLSKLIPTGAHYNKKVSNIFFIIGFITMLISLFINSLF